MLTSRLDFRANGPPPLHKKSRGTACLGHYQITQPSPPSCANRLRIMPSNRDRLVYRGQENTLLYLIPLLITLRIRCDLPYIEAREARSFMAVLHLSIAQSRGVYPVGIGMASPRFCRTCSSRAVVISAEACRKAFACSRPCPTRMA